MSPEEPDIATLIEQSSLGTPAAQTIRASADPAIVARVLKRAAEIEAAGQYE